MAPHFLFYNPSHGAAGGQIDNIMNGLKQIRLKQLCWARRKGLHPVCGAIGADGDKTYLQNLNDNLLAPLTQESVIAYEAGDGGETKDTKERLAKMKATHSSSAIVVNLFQYWQGKDISPLLSALNLGRMPREDYSIENLALKLPADGVIPKGSNNALIKFEQQYRICDDTKTFPRPANIDVVIEKPLCHIAIESKLTEPYRGKHNGLRKAYIENAPLWDNLPNLYELAKSVSPDNNMFRYLDVAQLIKHILGLTANYPRNKRKLKVRFKLLYLWYDVLGEDGVGHLKEIEKFAEAAKRDKVDFRHISYQEVIGELSECCYDGNESYIDYLTERYI